MDDQGSFMHVSSLKSAMWSTAQAIERHKDFESCLRAHYHVLLVPYSRRPFFYKSALKYSRLMVSFALLSEYFATPLPLLSEVKTLCVTRRYCSKNSLESMFLLLRALGFMEVAPHPEDSRFRVYAPSDEACREARLMLNSLTESLARLYPDRAIFRKMRELDDRGFLALYFRGFAIILDADLTVDVLLPECYWLVKRDAGHLLMLAIYNDAFAPENDRATFRSSSYLALAKQLSVSKTHIIRMVQEGVEKGYFKAHSKTRLEVLPPFVSLVKRFMAFSFAVGLHAIEMGA
ncbi:hypothetical protein BOP93_10060 [Pseudomonas orientalis]|uniref:Uncharacterized protein n=3 Tax=Pseudomonas TaxID=286 RepID=A0A2L0RV58_9PSED|nr:hypothetical protein BOP93_10060 [Pseudomonas orientalis]POM10880.1 hypothetical protein CUU62_00440 [Pseudomonas sp. WP001]RZI30804.1 hypothetical protein EUX57_15915 [Pseudomonas orientalis]